MILGLRTAIYPAPDLAVGKDFYKRVLGHDPYFDEPFYIGFSVGGFELGLIPDGTPGKNGVQVFWVVADIAAESVRLAGIGAVPDEAITDVGGGIKTASFTDPFGNRFGVIENPHFKLESVL